MYILETQDLTKKYGSLIAVDSINLKISKGSIYGFLGQNGAGKTTTIRMLTGLAKPTNGQIKINDSIVNFNSVNYKYDIGYLPDVPYFYKWMTAREYLNFCCKAFNIKEPDKRISELLDLAGLQDTNKRIGSYSRGMKQRLGIAQSLINNPKIIFMDEPTSALDPIGRKEVLNMISNLAGNTTVFFSTHILNDVEKVCDRVCIIDNGKIILEGDISDLKEKYYNSRFYLELSDNSSLLVDILKEKPWITDIKPSESGISFYSNDANLVQKSIPAIISENNWGLNKFIKEEPSLEDVFVKVVKTKYES